MNPLTARARACATTAAGLSARASHLRTSRAAAAHVLSPAAAAAAAPLSAPASQRRWSTMAADVNTTHPAHGAESRVLFGVRCVQAVMASQHTNLSASHLYLSSTQCTPAQIKSLTAAFVDGGGSARNVSVHDPAKGDRLPPQLRDAVLRTAALVDRGYNSRTPREVSRTNPADPLGVRAPGRESASVHTDGVVLVCPADAETPFYSSAVRLDPRPCGKPRVYVGLHLAGLSARDVGEIIEQAAAFSTDGVILLGPNVAKRFDYATLAYASRGAVARVPLFVPGIDETASSDLTEFVEAYSGYDAEEQVNRQCLNETIRFFGVYHSTRNARALTLRRLQNPTTLSGPPTPWCVLLGVLPKAATQASSIRLPSDVFKHCIKSVKLTPQNAAFFPLAPGSALVLSHLMEGHKRLNMAKTEYIPMEHEETQEGTDARETGAASSDDGEIEEKDAEVSEGGSWSTAGRS
eukprot:Rhum_TRINITY_DN2130_c0_g1::Rhum_TRINITY_DN2130_c0_g1_i1::g.6088::m.6088